MVTLATKQKDTREHINKVRGYIGEIVFNLQRRSLAHDKSKLEEPEVDGFWEMKQRTPLSAMEYDSPEYRAALAANQDTLRHHYEHNDHHPEHFEGGWHEMNYLQKLEALADWKAATERHPNGNLGSSIIQKAVRFGYDANEAKCLLETARELGWINDRPAI